MKAANKRNELIQIGSQIVVRQGFKAASINQILSHAGVPKGSFYYYFSSKEDFGLAIINDFAERYQNKLDNILGNETLSPLARLREYFELGIADMKNSECAHGCLMGNLAQELSAQNELFRDRLSQVFTDWEDSFTECLQAAAAVGEISSNKDISTLAKFILSGWQGAILQAKVAKSVSPMENFLEIVFEKLLVRDF